VGWTSDWTTFHKVGLWLPHEASGWDAQDSFRGAITVVGREYVGTYAGSYTTNTSIYYAGIATLPTDTLAPNMTSIVCDALDCTSAFVSLNTDVNANCGVAFGTSSGTYTITNNETAVGLSNFAHSFAAYTGLATNATVYFKPFATNIMSSTGTNGVEGSLAVSSLAPLDMWAMTEASGTKTYDSASAYKTGTNYNGVTWASPYGLTFLGSSSQYNDAGNTTDPGLSDWSWSFWFKYTASSSGQTYGLFGKSIANNINGRWGTYLSSGQITCILQCNGAKTIAWAETAYLDGNWHHLACSCTRSANMTMWIDGVYRATASVSNGSATSMACGTHLFTGVYGDSTGNNPGSGYYFTGSIGDTRIFNRALSTNEVLWIYAAGMK